MVMRRCALLLVYKALSIPAHPRCCLHGMPTLHLVPRCGIQPQPLGDQPNCHCSLLPEGGAGGGGGGRTFSLGSMYFSSEAQIFAMGKLGGRAANRSGAWMGRGGVYYWSG